MKVNDIIEGQIINIKKYGLFIKLNDNDTGFCHISNSSNKFIKDLADVFTIGQNVKVKVIKIDEDGHINVSIKHADKNYKSFKNKEKQYNTDNHQTVEPKSFDDMVNAFMKSSDERICSINKRNQRRNKR